MATTRWRLLVAAALALVGCLLQGGSHVEGPPPSWHVSAAATAAPRPLNLTELREESRDMFRFGFGQYMARAFPRDDLRPISCRGKDSQGGIALTLIDSLDTLLVMGEGEALREAVAWLGANATFDVDARVHVFELTIRAVGGLLSAHMLIEQDPSLVPGYDGCLLRLAVDLADRFMPAFQTPTGVPLSWVNLRKGQIPGDVRSTCVACAGTLLLEFGVLSRLTGNATYEAKARRAVETIYGMRSARGLVGNTLGCDSGRWERTDAGVGAGVDSFYEYLLKAYLAFGDEAYLRMFARLYAAAMAHLQLDPSWNGHVWLVDVDMHQGNVLHPYVWSLGAFWPGLQALAGQVEEGAALHANWTSAWHKFGWLPEMFDVGMENRHPTETGYPLRPELMESTFLLHAASGDPALLGVGASLHRRLRDRNRVACGYASVGDVSTGHLEDTMESFFLSETVKYLFLLFANASAAVDHFVLSTEGHFLPPFPDAAPASSARLQQGVNASEAAAAEHARHLQQQSRQGRQQQDKQQQDKQQQGTQQQQEQQEQQQGKAEQQGTCALSEAPSAAQRGQERAAESAASEAAGRFNATIEEAVEAKCRHLCAPQAPEAAAAAAAALRAALPLVPLPPGAPALLRARRCTACREVTRAVRAAELSKALAAATAGKALEATVSRTIRLSSKPAMAASGLRVNRQFVCVVEESRTGALSCAVLKELPPNQISPQRLDELPQNYLFIQLTDAPQPAGAGAETCSGAGPASTGGPQSGVEQVAVEVLLPGGRRHSHDAQLADFGPAFMPGCGKLVGSSADDGSVSAEGGGGSSSSSSGTAGGGAQQQPKPPGEPPTYMGRRLELRAGGPPERPWKVVHLGPPFLVRGGTGDGGAKAQQQQQQQRQAAAAAAAAAAEDDEDDPYADDPEEEAPGQQQQQQRMAADDDEEVYADGLEDEEAGEGPVVLCALEAPAAAAQPLEACGPLQNAAALKGAVAVVKRGGCMFVEKALAAQAAGALALVVVNTHPTELQGMGSDAEGTQSDIPAVLVSGNDGEALLRELLTPSATTEDGSPAVRLRLASAAAAEQPVGADGRTGSAGGSGQCGAGAGAEGGPRLQQAELLMSARAQHWLYHRLAAANRDPSAALQGVLAQLQKHFASQSQQAAAAAMAAAAAELGSP